jgi:hypothetical protein
MSDQGVSKDYVYALSNPALNAWIGDECRPLYKVGETFDIPQRVASLYSTGVPDRFLVEKAIHVYEGRAHVVEQEIHRRLSGHRYNNSREFFSCGLDIILEEFQRSVDSGECEWYNIPEPPPATRYPTQTSTEITLFREFAWKCYEKGEGSHNIKTRKRSNVETYLNPSNISKVLGALSENKAEFYRIADIPFEEHTPEDKNKFVGIVDEALTNVNKNLLANQLPYPRATLKMFKEAFTCGGASTQEDVVTFEEEMTFEGEAESGYGEEAARSGRAIRTEQEDAITGIIERLGIEVDDFETAEWVAFVCRGQEYPDNLEDVVTFKESLTLDDLILGGAHIRDLVPKDVHFNTFRLGSPDASDCIAGIWQETPGRHNLLGLADELEARFHVGMR